MAAERPQYYANTLAPVKVNRDVLQQVLQELRDATRSGADMVRKNVPPPEDGWGVKGFFFGISGTLNMTGSILRARWSVCLGFLDT